LRSRYLKLFSVLAALMLVAAGCGGRDDDTTTGGGGDEGAAASDIQVGLSLDIGGLGDQSFNDAANAGLQQAMDEGLVSEDNTQINEANASGSNRGENVELLAEEGFDLVVANGFAFSPDIDELAPQFPEVNFAITDGFAAEADNVTNMAFKEHEGSFLMGVAAAMKSEAGTIGFLGGQQGTGLIERFQAGYEAGAQAVNPDIEILVEYIGDDVTAFNDPTKGEALSNKMFDAGADIVYHAAGASGAGLFKAAVEQDQLAIGVDQDQSLTASPEQQEVILTSMLKRVDTAVFNVIQQVTEDDFQPGSILLGLAEEGVDYAVNEFNDNDELLSQDIQAEVDKFKQQIIDGEITVPDTPEG
jgi:basic membrane protein A and related proteins